MKQITQITNFDVHYNVNLHVCKQKRNESHFVCGNTSTIHRIETKRYLLDILNVC